MEFQEADKNLRDLVTEYQDKLHVDGEFKYILMCMWLYLYICFLSFLHCFACLFLFSAFFWLLFCCVMLSILRKTFCKSCKK